MAIVLCRKGAFLWSYADGVLRYSKHCGSTRSVTMLAAKLRIVGGIVVRTWDDGELEARVPLGEWAEKHAVAFGVRQKRVLGDAERARLAQMRVKAQEALESVRTRAKEVLGSVFPELEEKP